MSEPENNTENYEEVDEELLALREMKKKLVTEVCELRDKLKNEERRHELEVYANLNSSQVESDKGWSKNNSRLTQVSERIFGATFEDVNKNWLQDNTYEYKATVVTKSLHMFIELTVDLKVAKDFEIRNINCHFLENEVDMCYFKEIEPWIDMFTKMKNLSFLITVV